MSLSHFSRTATLLPDPEKTEERTCDSIDKLPISDAFREAFRWHPGGVALITADPGDGPVALTATSVTSVSVHPPVLMFSVSRHSSSGPSLKRAQSMVIHFLSAQEIDLAQLGATSGINRFADMQAWTRLSAGEPVFRKAELWLKVAVLRRVDVVGSTIIICQATDHNLDSGCLEGTRGSLAYMDRTWHALDNDSAHVPRL